MKSTHIDKLALGVALLALGATIWQANAQIKHDHVSVEPRITSYFSNNGNKNQWGIYAFNNGMGNAFVESLEVYVDGKPVQDHQYGKFFSAVTELGLNPLCFLIGGPRPNDAFQVGSEERLIEANPKAPKECALNNLLLQTYARERVDYELVFKSIYGERFKYRYSKNSQVPI
ncbi:hypothetical protein [Pseudomonas atagonensis]|uniref:hypothetical protein n=1 Tax=Pseudomonas atagonensis TaxID=2609964 RepID=UPI00140E80A5|nr:hypothetical protein [Pseudomonas atagonensis]